jgi:phenylpyruvate tautomerase PptA (4-oxalocrotonate tautomerase family)
MPILDIEIILRPGETLGRDLAAALAEQAAEIFGSAPGATWVKLKAIPADHYAENGGGPPEGVYPVFVSILKAKLPAAADMPAEVARLTAAIAHHCARPPENVHLFYLPPAAGRTAFGGNLIREG